MKHKTHCIHSIVGLLSVFAFVFSYAGERQRTPLEQTVFDFYEFYSVDGVPSDGGMKKFLTNRFYRGLKKAWAMDLDLGNPLIPGQDYDGKAIRESLTLKQVSPTSVRVTFKTFSGADKPYTKTVVLKEEDNRWRIADVIGEYGSYVKELPR